MHNGRYTILWHYNMPAKKGPNEFTRKTTVTENAPVWSLIF